MRMNKKLATGVAAGVIVLTGSGVALAYWTSTGTGAGQATTSTATPSVSVNQTSTITNLYPGAPAQEISGTVTNSGAGNAYVTSVTASIASVTGGAGCDATDYTLLNPVMRIGQDLAPSQTFDFRGATLAFNNKTGTNQDGCKSATVNLAYSSN